MLPQNVSTQNGLIGCLIPTGRVAPTLTAQFPAPFISNTIDLIGILTFPAFKSQFSAALNVLISLILLPAGQ